MLEIIGTTPIWRCDQCFLRVGVARGLVIYGENTVRGLYPAPRIVCGEGCAVKAEAELAPPRRRMSWSAFLRALAPEEDGRER